MQDSRLACGFLNFQLNSPLVLASGIIGTSATLMARAARAGAGMVTAKSCGPAPRAGHPNPVALDWGGGLINAIGLTNPGAEHEAVLLAETKRALQPLGVPLIASIFAGTVQEFGEVAAIVARAEPDLIEVNISCPNVGDEFGTPFAGSPESAAAVTESVRRAVTIPISVKLAPNVPDIARIAAAVVEAGADAITAVNTVPGMVIDPELGSAGVVQPGGWHQRAGAQADRSALRLRDRPARERADHRHRRRDHRPGCGRDAHGRRDRGWRRFGGVVPRCGRFSADQRRAGGLDGATRRCVGGDSAGPRA